MDKSFRKILPHRKLSSHKGDYGHLFVLAGSPGMTGAAYLCARAGLLAGSGLVTLGLPESLNSIMEVKLTEVMTRPLPETSKQTLSRPALSRILDFIEEVSGLAIGPGLSREEQTASLIRLLLVKIDKPFVLDADGINALSGRLKIIKRIKAPGVITPHPGEMARLLEVTPGHIQSKRKQTAASFAKKYNITVVLKGHRTVVANPAGKIYVNKTGNPGMATAGAGDVLCGLIGSLLGQGLDPWTASCLGAYMHGLAGDIAAQEKGVVSLCAGDLLNNLPAAIKSMS